MLSRKQNIAYDIILHVVIVMWPTQSFVSLHYHSQLLSGSKVSIEGTLWNLTGNSHAAFHLLLFEYNILFFFISREIFNIGHSDCVFMMQFYVIMTSSKLHQNIIKQLWATNWPASINFYENWLAAVDTIFS